MVENLNCCSSCCFCMISATFCDKYLGNGKTPVIILLGDPWNIKNVMTLWYFSMGVNVVKPIWLRAEWHLSLWDGFETSHGLVPQFMAYKMPAFISDEKKENDAMCPCIVSNMWKVNCTSSNFLRKLVTTGKYGLLLFVAIWTFATISWGWYIFNTWSCVSKRYCLP